MSQKNAPVGLGVWVAYANKWKTPEDLLASVKEVGAQWIAPKAGDGGHRGGFWTKEYAAKAIPIFHTAGVKIFPWVYSYPNSTTAEVTLLKAVIDEGTDGVFLDCEIEWQRAGRFYAPFAAAYGKNLRAAIGPDVFVAHAPFPYVEWHRDFPYEAFATFCDGVCDQLYWTEIDGQGAQHHIDAVQPQWDSFYKSSPASAIPRRPIGVTYGRIELEKVQKTPPPGKFALKDLAYFVDWCESKQLPYYSLYSLEASAESAIEYLRNRNAAKKSERKQDAIQPPAPLPVIVPPPSDPIVVKPTPIPPAPLVPVQPASFFALLLRFVQFFISLFRRG